MSDMLDVSVDLPRLGSRLSVRGLAPEEVAPLAEELVAYAQHFAPFFYRREQREWAAVYLRGLLTADVPRKNVEAMALRLLGVGSHAEQQVRAYSSSLAREPGTMKHCWPSINAWSRKHWARTMAC